MGVPLKVSTALWHPIFELPDLGKRGVIAIGFWKLVTGTDREGWRNSETFDLEGTPTVPNTYPKLLNFLISIQYALGRRNLPR